MGATFKILFADSLILLSANNKAALEGVSFPVVVDAAAGAGAGAGSGILFAIF